jgi:uncharacterized protein YndB with AHSA1/START domain
MEKITQQRNIKAPVSKVRAALTAQEGLRAWWTPDCEVKGEQATFRFAQDGGVMELQFRVDEAAADRVAWTCTHQKNNPDWQGTQVAFQLSPTHDGTRLDFAHSGWKEKSRVYEMCVGGWDHFLDSLEAYLESGKGQPFGS